MSILKEACIENATFLREYINAGANRIELCDNLFVGGTTPSLGTVLYAKNICSEKNAELAVMIRARGGDFVYKDFEKDIMLRDVKAVIESGGERIVIGALTNVGDIDKKFIQELTVFARNLNQGIKFTFHMAFDHICLYKDEESNIKYRREKIEELKDMGIDTILTHGSRDKGDIFENVEVLNTYINLGNKIGLNIMPGGGINYENLDSLLKLLKPVKAIHGTRIVNPG